MAVWCLAEIIFYVAIRILANSVNKLTTPAKYNSCPEQLVKRILDNLDNMKTYDITTFFRGWFMGTDLDDVYQDNFRSFLAWVLFAKVFSDVSDDERIKLENTATHIYERMCWTPKAGFNKKVQHVGMTLEDISYTHRPHRHISFPWFPVSTGEVDSLLASKGRIIKSGTDYFLSWYDAM
jgi:hypothetical protein